RRGFTLVELMVAMSITIILGMVVVMAYNSSMQAYVHTERKIQALAAFRNTADRLEREVNSMVFKAGVWERPIVEYDDGPGRFYNQWWETMVKYIHGDPTSPNPGVSRRFNTPVNIDWTRAADGRSMYQINFRPRYMGYYSTLDGFTIDRTELYYNPAEDRQVWDNGADDDGDDPVGDAGLRTLYDDKGCLMFRKTFDRDMCWAEWYNPADMLAPRLGAANVNRVRPNDYRDPFHGPYSLSTFPPPAAELAGPLTGDQIADAGVMTLNGTPLANAAAYQALSAADKRKAQIESGFIVDSGTVIGEGFSDLRFNYLYKLNTSDRFIYADWWPWDDDANPTNVNGKEASMPVHNIKVVQGGTVSSHVSIWDGNTYVATSTAVANAPISTNFDIAYFTLPVAVSVKFTFTVNRQAHVYEKLIYLHASRWLMYLNP
ncbi:MAG TPA: prepilin-type N-terminal cleavage/methylation domain-containing protein, partial [Planctomycetota bacterium]|nr:prepilin-type N-terminal cleavage/methylation domain-containing protein [Planctomycetota bacterium]